MRNLEHKVKPGTLESVRIIKSDNRVQVF